MKTKKSKMEIFWKNLRKKFNFDKWFCWVSAIFSKSKAIIFLVSGFSYPKCLKLKVSMEGWLGYLKIWKYSKKFTYLCCWFTFLSHGFVLNWWDYLTTHNFKVELPAVPAVCPLSHVVYREGKSMASYFYFLNDLLEVLKELDKIDIMKCKKDILQWKFLF